MIQNLIYGILFLKIDYFGNATYLYPFTRASGHHQSFSISDLLAESLNVRKKSHFIIQFCSKNLPHFTNLNLLDTENNMLPQHSQQPFWLYKVSMKYVSVWCQQNRNSFSLNHFLKPKNYIVEANFGMFLYISVR